MTPDMTPNRLAAVDIRHELKPGDVGRVTYLHGTLYAAEHGYDHTFDAYVARPLADFVLRKSPSERIWLVEADGNVDGCIAIVEADEGAAQVRWFLLHPRLRGHGLGRLLLTQALEFSHSVGYRTVFLWTVRGLEAAAALYREAGFRLIEERTHPMWGQVICEQRYELMRYNGL